MMSKRGNRKRGKGERKKGKGSSGRESQKGKINKEIYKRHKQREEGGSYLAIDPPMKIDTYDKPET